MHSKKRQKKNMRERERRESQKSSDGGNQIRQFNMEMPLVYISLVDELPSCIIDEMTAGRDIKNFSVSRDQTYKSGPAAG